MAISVDQLVRELRAFDGRREIVKAIGKGVRKPLPDVRKAVRAFAKDNLPRSGGLGTWVAGTRITASIKLAGRKAGIKLKGGRNSAEKRTDTKAIDAGRVRAPSWGRRGKGAWHVQSVPPGFFTKPVSESDQWIKAVDAAVNDALQQIRR